MTTDARVNFTCQLEAHLAVTVVTMWTTQEQISVFVTMVI